MSNRPCNKCELDSIKRRAKKENMIVTTKPSNFMGGTVVFVHPKGVEIKNSNNWDDNPYFVAWFMEVPSSCAC